MGGRSAKAPPKTVELKAAVREAVALARKNHRETCGLLIDSGYAIELVAVRNTARRPGHFVFDARQVRALQRAARLIGHEVLGTYHSHPVSPPRPGRGDIEGTLNDSLMLIIDCIEREARLCSIGPVRVCRLVTASNTALDRPPARRAAYWLGACWPARAAKSAAKRGS